jgi:hypothetical protein
MIADKQKPNRTLTQALLLTLGILIALLLSFHSELFDTFRAANPIDNSEYAIQPSNEKNSNESQTEKVKLQAGSRILHLFTAALPSLNRK